jgi:hypothetical protein
MLGLYKRRDEKDVMVVWLGALNKPQDSLDTFWREVERVFYWLDFERNGYITQFELTRSLDIPKDQAEVSLFDWLLVCLVVWFVWLFGCLIV